MTGTTIDQAALDKLCVDTIRTLSIDTVQKANSGHPGAPGPHPRSSPAARRRQ